MSSSHYSLSDAQHSTIRGKAKLRNAAKATYDGDWHSVPHTHNYMELFYIVRGKGQFMIEDQYYPVSADDLVIINPTISHTEVSLNSLPLEYLVLGIEGFELSVTETANEKFCILDHAESSEISSCISNIISEMELRNEGYEDICQAFMEILLIRLMRTTALSLPEDPLVAAGHRQCAAVRRYIDLHFKESLTLDQLAKEGRMNKYYLSHTFKREYGISPINYLISKRIEESKYLLAETDLSMSQIAQMLGFSSLSYFSQTFRKSQSVSPIEYRQRCRNE